MRDDDLLPDTPPVADSDCRCYFGRVRRLVVIAAFGICMGACSLVFSASDEQATTEARCLAMPSDVEIGVQFCSSEIAGTSVQISEFNSTSENGLTVVPLRFRGKNEAPLMANVTSDGAISFSLIGAQSPDQGLADACNEGSAMTIEVVMRHRDFSEDELLRFVELRRQDGGDIIVAFGINSAGDRLMYRTYPNNEVEPEDVETVVELDAPLGENEIHHIAVVEGGNVGDPVIYLDGNPLSGISSGAAVGQWGDDLAANLVVGDTDSPGGPVRSWDGDLHFLGIYCSALEETLIRDRYRALEL